MKFLLPLFFLLSLVSPLKFTVIGDFGGQSHLPYTTEIQLKTAGAILKSSQKFNPDFYVNVGDNFYETGVKDVTSHRFKETFENVYKEHKRWYIIAGNHDHLGNIQAQIKYTGKGTGRWWFPSLYYNISNPQVDLIFLDTVLFNSQQVNWLQSHLQNYSSTTRIVFGHFPVWSVGVHGPTPHLIQELKPLLEKYRIVAYICGHDHNIQHLEQNGVEYFVTGNGALANPHFPHKNSVPEGSLKFSWGQENLGAFLQISLDDNIFNVTALSSELKTLFSFNKRI